MLLAFAAAVCVSVEVKTWQNSASHLPTALLKAVFWPAGRR